MSVVVRMEMPSNCEKCPMCGTGSCGNGMYKLWCMCGDIPASSQRRPDDCPILCQLPEGHGRLIDGDKLMGEMKNRKWMIGRASDPDCLVFDAHTIVPAERSET